MSYSFLCEKKIQMQTKLIKAFVDNSQKELFMTMISRSVGPTIPTSHEIVKRSQYARTANRILEASLRHIDHPLAGKLLETLRIARSLNPYRAFEKVGEIRGRLLSRYPGLVTHQSLDFITLEAATTSIRNCLQDAFSIAANHSSRPDAESAIHDHLNRARRYAGDNGLPIDAGIIDRVLFVYDCNVGRAAYPPVFNALHDELDKLTSSRNHPNP